MHEKQSVLSDVASVARGSRRTAKTAVPEMAGSQDTPSLQLKVN